MFILIVRLTFTIDGEYKGFFSYERKRFVFVYKLYLPLCSNVRIVAPDKRAPSISET
jgi:hypothetical protein